MASLVVVASCELAGCMPGKSALLCKMGLSRVVEASQKCPFGVENFSTKLVSVLSVFVLFSIISFVKGGQR